MPNLIASAGLAIVKFCRIIIVIIPYFKEPAGPIIARCFINWQNIPSFACILIHPMCA
jgi:hypothetical protein